MFYKEIDGELFGAEVINLPDGSVISAKNQFNNYGWVWLDIPPVMPKLYGLGVVIPENYRWVFVDGKFVVDELEVPLINDTVDIGYFMWQALRNRLDSGAHDFLKRALMPLWNYVKEQVEQNNLVTIQ
jgi:hypothetical protein